MKKYLFVASMVCLSFSSTSYAQENLNVVCSANDVFAGALKNKFEELNPDIKVSLLCKGAGSAFAQILAEAKNPKIDVWWGGTGDNHMQAAYEDLTMPYKSEQLKDLHPWAVKQAEQAEFKTVGIYAGALGIGYNKKLLDVKGLPTPKCWKDLADPVYRNEIQMANPNASGTAYTTLATLVQIFGEDEAFKLLAEINKNISQYTSSGGAPIKNAAAGETTIGITFMHDMVPEVKQGFPIEIVSPCEGTGYEIGSMSIIKNARNLEAAKKWVEFALSPEAQSLGGPSQSYQVPANKLATVPEEAIKMEEVNLIDYDFTEYGKKETRKRLLARWDKEIKATH